MLSLRVNGAEHRLEVEPRRLLADVLREDLGLTGTHLGCEQGACGACTVLLDGAAVRSCLLFAVQAEGAEVTTVEALAPGGGELHPLQEAFRDHHALQCGFCTPGMLLAALDLLARSPSPSADEVREELAGNLCRCTGYQRIIAAVLDGAARMNRSFSQGSASRG
ncbi:MAG TPA: (2Fe-2S)-binding protein [Candidatus Dormibacteraeota bacterium]|nr:(2Fe-2S)-binding protein [Candidatus Dormibacteraeota bacterium]